ncbi:uncharacterized protein LOC118407892 [Branchiostoma floridae]|uniref:Uncharacterized protein LOC118407892 n=1 Tax=Branchiostoma floridae TaxID=7739 RepID=A0A9J7HRC8_BRAFL|nr:uncharacterized protein LOC118407892 [Branchiostoma floridae]
MLLCVSEDKRSHISIWQSFCGRISGDKDITMSAPVLRGDVTLVNHNLMEVFKAVMSEAPLPDDDQLARFDPEVPLRSMSGDELKKRLSELTGEDAELLLAMTGKDVKAQETIVRLAHFTILAANSSAAATQKITASPAGKTAAQAVANMLEGQGDATGQKAPSTATRESDTTKPPPAKKAKKSKQPPPPTENDSDSDEAALEDETLQREVDKVKEMCLDPLIHRYPAKLHGALMKLVETARRTRAKQMVVARYMSVAEFCLRHAAEEGIGEQIRLMLMTPGERRFMEEARRAEAALHGRRAPHPTAAWGPPPDRFPPRRQDEGATGWGPPPARRPFQGRGGARRSQTCYNCGKKGHWAKDCFLPPKGQ